MYEEPDERMTSESDSERDSDNSDVAPGEKQQTALEGEPQATLESEPQVLSKECLCVEWFIAGIAAHQIHNVHPTRKQLPAFFFVCLLVPYLF